MNNRDSTNVRGLLGQLFFEIVFGETQLRGSIWGIDRGHMKYILIYVLFFMFTVDIFSDLLIMVFNGGIERGP